MWSLHFPQFIFLYLSYKNSYHSCVLQQVFNLFVQGSCYFVSNTPGKDTSSNSKSSEQAL